MDTSVTDDEIRACVEPFADRVGGPIRALQELMRVCGSIEASFAPVVAEVFNISQAEVRGIVGFYDDFNRPPARHRIRICQAEACQALGSRSLTRELEASYRTTLGGEPEEDAGEGVRDVVLEPVYCLGLCAVGPAAQVNGKLVGRATPDKLKLEP